jgi:hypothetical protein
MSSSPLRRALLALPAIALLAAAPAAESKQHDGGERLVVRGEATILDAPCAPAVCLEMGGGAFRGTLGTGAYTGAMTLAVAEAYPNGEGGVCAPIGGRITLGAGTADRLVLAVDGDSCQDGAGDPRSASFTTVATFKVAHGAGAYASAHGRGVATFAEDAADHDRMTLVGRIAR